MPKPSTKQLCPADLITAESFPYQPWTAIREAVPQSRPVYQDIEHLAAVRELYPWAKSVVVCITWLGAYRYPLSLQGLYGKAFLLSPDTVPDCEAHRQKLHFETWLAEQGLRFEGGETNAPARIIPLRYAAVAAGLGIFRKNLLRAGRLSHRPALRVYA